MGHVWIISPREHEANFVNRKGYHSINVQVKESGQNE